jgi:hypothetical protein
MSGTLRLRGTTSGYSELQAPAVAGDQTFILPATGGTLLTTASPAPTLTLESGTVTSPSLTFEGDSNTGIYSPGANEVAITTGGGQRLFVSNNGRVGIGTASPDAQLKVQSPNSDSITSAFAVRQNNAADSAQATCIIEQDPLNSSSRIIANGTTTPSLKLGTASTVAVTIDSTQQVGIGTSSPAGNLNIQTSTATGPSLTYDSANILNLDYGIVQLAAGIDPSSPFGSYLQSRDNTNAARTLNLNPAGGNVGIGTTNPGQALAVNGSVAGNNFLANGDSTTFGIPGTDTAIIMYGTGFTSDPNRILFRTGTVNRGEIDAFGRVVMGGIAPGTSVSYSFCTSGRLQTTASYTNTTGSAANMHIGSTGLVVRSTSSARYKRDIETLEDSYADKLLECRPVWYRSTATDDTAHPEWGYYGFIAEEVADVDPRLVHYDEQEDGTLQPEGVQYTQMIAHLVNIVKRQKQQLVNFEARLSALETAN